MRAFRTFALALAFALASLPADQLELTQSNEQWVGHLLQEVRRASFTELSDSVIRVRPFRSESDYFQARFTLSRFFVPARMRYVLRVNEDQRLQAVSTDAVRAIIAHELAHVDYYASRNRLRLLALMRLATRAYRRNFERQADLEAIRLGYAPGLEAYRLWLYRNVPAKALREKKRDYLSPSEIVAAAKNR